MERVLTNLNDWASNLCLATQTLRLEGTLIYPDGRREPVVRSEKRLLARVEIMQTLGSGPLDSWDLHRYTLPNGDVYVEYVQDWGSSDGDDCIHFIALKDARGDVVVRSLWSKTEMDAVLGREPRGWLGFIGR